MQGSNRKNIHSDDPMQPGYTYELVADTGKDFDTGFTPDLSPKRVLELGVFGGAYFDGVPKEFPSEWFAKARLSSNGPSNDCNYFGVMSSQPARIWHQKGWMHEDDPRGWFQWYCRYYLGRRMPVEDQRQIGRWRAIRRHVAQVQKACHPGDATCHTKQRQALLHWAYDSRNL